MDDQSMSTDQRIELANQMVTELDAQLQSAKRELENMRAQLEAKANRQIVVLRVENWTRAVEKLQSVKGAEYVGEVEFRSVVDEALELLTKVDDGRSPPSRQAISLMELAAEWRASGEGRRDAHAEQEGQVYLQCAEELEELVGVLPTEPSYDVPDGGPLRDWERAAYEAVARAPRVTFNEAMLAGVVARVFGLEYTRPTSSSPYDPVPSEVHDRGWQWRPVDPGTAFAPPFGTIRVCSCGCLVAGGPSVCGRCPPLDAEEWLPRGDAKDLTGCDV